MVKSSQHVREESEVAFGAHLLLMLGGCLEVVKSQKHVSFEGGKPAEKPSVWFRRALGCTLLEESRNAVDEGDAVSCAQLLMLA
jgi:hypothetical protein